jgi:hypothetical protein
MDFAATLTMMSGSLLGQKEAEMLVSSSCVTIRKEEKMFKVLRVEGA